MHLCVIVLGVFNLFICFLSLHRLCGFPIDILYRFRFIVGT